MRIDQSELSQADVQRLINFCAHHSHQTYAIAQTFVDQVAKQFPKFAGAFPLATQRQRAEVGQMVAAFARSFDSPKVMQNSCQRVGRVMARCGMHASDASFVRSTLESALRQHAGVDWTHDVANAWGQSIDAWLGMAVASMPEQPSAGVTHVRKAA